MTPSHIPVAFREALLDTLASHGYSNILVIEADQPNRSGRVDDGIYWRMTDPKNYGWQARRYSPVEREAHHAEHQLYEATITLTALVSDEDSTGYSSDDLATLAQMCVNSLPFVEVLRRGKIGVQRASPVRTLTFTDEADNYSKESSFTVIVTFMRTITPNTKTVDAIDLNTLRI